MAAIHLECSIATLGRVEAYGMIGDGKAEKGWLRLGLRFGGAGLANDEQGRFPKMLRLQLLFGTIVQKKQTFC